MNQKNDQKKKMEDFGLQCILEGSFTTAPMPFKTTASFVTMLWMGSSVAWERMLEGHAWPPDGQIKMDDFKVGIELLSC